MILLIIEFGGVILLNIGVARGFAFLFAGFYFRKENNVVSIRAYLVAGGSFRIAGLITASVTFYMGLEGNGHTLQGRCYVQYSFKIGLLELSFLLTFKKQIAGATTQNSSEKSGFMLDENNHSVSDEADEFINAKIDWDGYLKSFKKI